MASQRSELHRELAEVEDREQLACRPGSPASRLCGRRSESGGVESLAGILLKRQDEVGYNTRLAVAQEALNSAQARKAERQLTLERFRSQVADSQARLDETQASLQQLESEQAGLRERQAGLNQVIEDLRAQISPIETDLERSEQEEQRLQHGRQAQPR
jgi:chromosome segregation ATPase